MISRVVGIAEFVECKLIIPKVCTQ